MNHVGTDAGRYTVVEERRGGMGRVYLCRDAEGKDPNALCVLKTLLEELVHDRNARGRFENEASAWLALGDTTDNYVLTLREIVRHGGLPYLKMDFCSRGSLADRLSKGPIPAEQAVVWGTELLIGMDAVDGDYHLVHRDLKPANILFDDADNVKISDLGLVKAVHEPSAAAKVALQNTGLTQFRGFVGTVPYAAPEQLLGLADIDQRCDIWAFGLILYEMLARSIHELGQHIDRPLSFSL